MTHALNLQQIIELKAELKEKFPTLELHTHDACGAQSFSLTAAEPDLEEALKYIGEYTSQFGLELKVGSDGKTFWLV